MNNILLVFTGGTIGSTSINGTINTSDQAHYKLLNLFNESHPSSALVQFKILQPLHILSENLQPQFWQQLINSITAEELDQYDGIIVTHGTDTLAYSAAILGLYFNDLKIPLLLVSSHHPLDHPGANGLKNFICAVEYIKQQKPAGVFVPYQNPNQIQQLHIGTRLNSSLPLSDIFISVQSQVYMTYHKGRFNQIQNIHTLHCKKTTLKADFSTRILIIRPYPGLDYSVFNLSQTDVVLHDLYHSGTACTSTDYGRHHSLINFSKRCQDHEIPLFLAPAIQHTEVYTSTRQLLDQGTEIIWNMSLESAYAKLLLAYCNYTERHKISAFLQDDIALEHI